MHVLFKVDGRPLHVRALGAERALRLAASSLAAASPAAASRARQRASKHDGRKRTDNHAGTAKNTAQTAVSPPERRGLAPAPLGLRPLSWRRMRCAYSGGPSAALHMIESVAQCGDLVWAEAVDELSKCLSGA